MEKNLDLREFMSKIVKYLGSGTFSRRKDGAIVYDAPCSCGNPLCGDEVVLSPTGDRLVWTRWWGSETYYDKWAFSPDGDLEYLGTVEDDGGFRYPPVMPE
jgi:hypothetical protein